MKFILVMLLLLSIYSSEEIAAPADLHIVLEGAVAHLSWTDNSDNEEGFWVYKDGRKHAKLDENATHFDDDVSDKERHTYFITAFIGDIESKGSNEFNIRAEGISNKVLYLGIPLIIFAAVVAYFLGRKEGDVDEDMSQDERDEPILITDRLRKI
ncbi:MAG: hypothetical protein ACXQTP_06250 [Candidatus Methanofastidiosia archaeon]